jgi:hypothetical protein
MCMKQSEVNKLVKRVMKVISSKFGWQCKEGCIFKRKGLLFFAFVVFGYVKKNEISCKLEYKYFDFDEVFWNIVDLKENMKQPLSFHYFGVWTAPTMYISEERFAIDEWSETALTEKIEKIVREIDIITDQISEKITTANENLEYLESLYSVLRQKYPQTTVNIYKERLMTAILNRDFELAIEIAEDRISHNDTGRFLSGRGNFYEQAIEYIKGVQP